MPVWLKNDADHSDVGRLSPNLVSRDRLKEKVYLPVLCPSIVTTQLFKDNYESQSCGNTH